MNTDPELERLILKHVKRPNYQPVKPRVIAKKLNISAKQVQDFKRAVKSLVKQGQLTYGSNHIVRLAKAKKDGQIVGRFRRAAGGFGFVRPTGAANDRSGDIYIPAKKTGDAANGDLVAVRLSKGKPGPPNLSRGEIVDVVERETHQFVGTYSEDAGSGYVQIDGTVFAQPILVGDAGAKNARDGDKVVVEMVRFPAPFAEGEGVITEVLGPRGKAGVDTLTIMREFRLPEGFPDEVLESGREVAEEFDGEFAEDRLDLRDQTVITIDPVDARDFDDAISLERIENGHWRLGVHIADVTHFVQPNTPLDNEARSRATSVYLPDRVIPMLPEVISNNLASLQPQRVRFARTAFIEFTGEGVRVSAEMHRSAIRSRRRFAYEEVDQFLADPESWREQLKPDVFDLLGRMHELAMILRERRLSHGAIELNLPEIKIDLDREGRVSGAHVTENTVSHQIIEEFMLAANEAVAELLDDQELIFLRRVHSPPDPRKLKQLTQFVRELGIDCESLESRFEIKRVIEQVSSRPERHAVNYAVLRSMQKAIYSPTDEGHYALASPAYCHFTSPIRRYPDLIIHRMFDILASGKRPPQDFGEMAMLGEHCSDREQRAEKAERELKKVKLLNYLKGKIGSQMDAVVTGVEEYGLFAQGVELPAEGLLHVDALQGDYYDFDRQAHTLVGRRSGKVFRLGDVIRVEVAHVDLDRRELDFRLVTSAEPKFKAPRGKTSGKHKRAKSVGTARQPKSKATKKQKGTGKKKRR